MARNTDDTRLVAILLGIIGVIVLAPMAFGVMGLGMMGSGPMMGDMWGRGGMWADGAMPGWLLVVGVAIRLLFLGALVGGGYLLYRALTGDDESDRALEELRLSYARGELSDDEYEHRREALERDTESR